MLALGIWAVVQVERAGPPFTTDDPEPANIGTGKSILLPNLLMTRGHGRVHLRMWNSIMGRFRTFNFISSLQWLSTRRLRKQAVRLWGHRTGSKVSVSSGNNSPPTGWGVSTGRIANRRCRARSRQRAHTGVFPAVAAKEFRPLDHLRRWRVLDQPRCWKPQLVVCGLAGSTPVVFKADPGRGNFSRNRNGDGGNSDTKFNVGTIFDFSPTYHLLLSAGHTIQGPSGFQAYIAFQVTFGPGEPATSSNK